MKLRHLFIAAVLFAAGCKKLPDQPEQEEQVFTCTINGVPWESGVEFQPFLPGEFDVQYEEELDKVVIRARKRENSVYDAEIIMYVDHFTTANPATYLGYGSNEVGYSTHFDNNPSASKAWGYDSLSPGTVIFTKIDMQTRIMEGYFKVTLSNSDYPDPYLFIDGGHFRLRF